MTMDAVERRYAILERYDWRKARENHQPDAIPMSHVLFSAEEYFAAHWVMPRGRGSWGFYLSNGRGYLSPRHLVWVPDGEWLFTEARKWITEFAARKGLRYVSVAP